MTLPPGRDELESMSATEQRIFHLQRQLDIETKVRQGAENMLGQFNTGTKDKKLLIEAEELLQDSKAKIEYLRMRILKTKQQNQNAGTSVNTDKNFDTNKSVEITELDERIEELRHHLRIESACLEGAKNVLKILTASKSQDKKALQEVISRKLVFNWNIKKVNVSGPTKPIRIESKAGPDSPQSGPCSTRATARLRQVAGAQD